MMSSKNRCTTANYESNEDGSIKVTNEQISRWTNKVNSVVGEAIMTPEQGLLSVAFGPRKPNDEGNYLVLDTDNDRFSYVWSCKQYCIKDWCVGHKPTLFILNRNPYNSEEEVLVEIGNSIQILGENFGYDEKSMEKLKKTMRVTNHADCGYEEIFEDENLEDEDDEDEVDHDEVDHDKVDHDDDDHDEDVNEETVMMKIIYPKLISQTIRI